MLRLGYINENYYLNRVIITIRYDIKYWWDFNNNNSFIDSYMLSFYIK